MSGSDGLQEGDPDRGASVIRTVLDLPDAPLRLPLGAEAVRNLTRTYEQNLAAVQRTATLSVSADFPDSVASSRPPAAGADAVNPPA